MASHYNGLTNKMEEFLANYEECGEIAKSAEQCGICRKTVYNWRQQDFFRDRMDEAERVFRMAITPVLEASLYKKAIGYEYEETRDEVTDTPDGKIVKHVTTRKKQAPDTAAIIFALCNLSPEKWTNKQRMEVAGSDGSRIQIEFASGKDQREAIKMLKVRKDKDQ